MKAIFLFITMLLLSNCAAVDAFIAQKLRYHVAYDGYPFVSNPKEVFLIYEIKECTFKEKISPTNHIWRKGAENLIQLELQRLQSIADVRGANSISNVIIRDSNNPLGEADAYICPEDIYRKNSQYQSDKLFFDKVVKVID